MFWGDNPPLTVSRLWAWCGNFLTNTNAAAPLTATAALKATAFREKLLLIAP